MTHSISVNVAVLKALAKHIAASSENRYYLCGVQVESTPEAVTYCATDGHKLVVHRDEFNPENDGTERPTFSVILPREVLVKFKADKYLSYAVLKVDGFACSLGFGDEGVTFKAVDGRFPDWRKVIPAETSGETAQFNPEYLVAISKALAECDGMKLLPCFHLNHNGNSAATMIQNNTVAVIMPWCAGEPSSTPSWAIEAKAKLAIAA